ncbi:fluoride efflux transporter CrcB [Pigmentiphaga sp.]|uniref:fluoride efflux transporter CrcB n=1 Tax=Pigmentiphaga sp. TaxID=1977564 RepID=UPI00128D20D6|nr:fluoride efflux transporter CrcB [Pigmentiphaga sp.]MPS29808.1 fluoride efflux transporter CrcB [Alcaligenaceae bacterium SAGV5]MPS51533.1 fluoride efflux transporter CrcB [Alcaligenaceae bacterium SAGV3]MPT55542.1 fluoride efflux transporter CrcB [Alcaligenaceae bacterium]
MLLAVVAIAIGAAVGALLRWVLGLSLNALLPALPPGTLAANLIGAYIIGLAVAYFAGNPALPPHWRLLIITGFCGGLTTFSTFSAELVALIQQERLGWVAATILVHVGGSVAMTLLGIATYAGLRQS